MRNLIKKKMIDAGRDDFVNCLAEILNCTRQTAGSRLKGDSKFTENEIAILTLKLGFTGDELKNAIVKD